MNSTEPQVTVGGVNRKLLGDEVTLGREARDSEAQNDFEGEECDDPEVQRLSVRHDLRNSRAWWIEFLQMGGKISAEMLQSEAVCRKIEHGYTVGNRRKVNAFLRPPPPPPPEVLRKAWHEGQTSEFSTDRTDAFRQWRSETSLGRPVTLEFAPSLDERLEVAAKHAERRRREEKKKKQTGFVEWSPDDYVAYCLRRRPLPSAMAGKQVETGLDDKEDEFQHVDLMGDEMTQAEREAASNEERWWQDRKKQTGFVEWSPDDYVAFCLRRRPLPSAMAAMQAEKKAND